MRLAVLLGLDRHNPQREMISQLISDLYSYFLTEHDIASGFDELLATLDDLHLDTPDAPSVSRHIRQKMLDKVTRFVW